MRNKFVGITAIGMKTAMKLFNFKKWNQKTASILYLKHSIFYQNVFKANQIDIKNINLQNLSKIPPTTKEDLQANIFTFLSVRKKQIAEYFATSGTLGNPVTIAQAMNT